MALRLGIEVFPLGEDGWCLPCPGPCAAGPDATLDRLGFHAMGCCRGRTARHDDARDVLYTHLRRHVSDRNVLREAACDPAGEAYPGAPGQERPGDVAVRDSRFGWSFIDVSVCSIGHADVKRASCDGLLASRRAWRLKDESDAAARVRRTGSSFIPMAFGAWGDIFPSSAAALKSEFHTLGATPSDHQEARTALSAAVALGTARAVVRGLGDAQCRRPPVPPEYARALARDVAGG